MWKGDFLAGAEIPIMWQSTNSLGASATPSSLGSVIVYRGGSSVATTSVGVSENSIGVNGIAGSNRIVVTSSSSANFYRPHEDYHVVLSLFTIDSQLVSGPLASFSINNRMQAGLISRSTASAGAAGSITLNLNESSTNSFLEGATVFLSDFTGENQARIGNAYTGATRLLATDRQWITNPAAGTAYELYAGSTPSTVGEIQSGLTQAIADSLLSRNIAGGSDGGRMVKEALYALRNKVDASGSVGTVYQTDDSTSGFTFSRTTGAFPLQTIDPA